MDMEEPKNNKSQSRINLEKNFKGEASLLYDTNPVLFFLLNFYGVSKD